MSSYVTEAMPTAFGSGLEHVSIKIDDDSPIRLRPNDLDLGDDPIGGGYTPEQAKVLINNLQAAVDVCLNAGWKEDEDD